MGVQIFVSGQYYDVETNKHYNFNRDYNPLTGRYIQSDPIGLDGGVNTFAYALGNPAKNLDVNGLYTIAEVSSFWDSSMTKFNKWVEAEKKVLWNWLPKLPKCPKRIVVRNNEAFSPNSSVWNEPSLANQTYHPGAKFEMRSTAVSGNHGNQCAYDPFGNIIKTIPAAGSADYQTGVWWNVVDHYLHDVHPYEEADRLGWVTKYFSVRPVWTE